MTIENFRPTEAQLEFLVSNLETHLDANLARNWDREEIKDHLEALIRKYNLPSEYGESGFQTELDELSRLTNLRKGLFENLAEDFPHIATDRPEEVETALENLRDGTVTNILY